LNADEARVRWRETGDAIVIGVEANLARVLRSRVAVIADAWGRLEPTARARLEGDAQRATDAATERVVRELRILFAQRATDAATERVVRELRILFALDPVEQRATPLEIVRSSYREPTAALAAAGIPGVVRDPFDERSWPDDEYGLVIRTLAEVDDELGPMQLAWGLAKARLLRA
jgi:hypothetical protein